MKCSGSSWLRGMGFGALALLVAALGIAATKEAKPVKDAPVVVVLGDSTTKGMGVDLPDLKRELEDLIKSSKDRPKLVNAGVGGDTAGGGLARLEQDVLAHQPDVVTVSFGLNDTGKDAPAKFKDNVKEIVAALQKAKVKVVLVTSTPFDNNRHSWGKVQKYQDQGGLDEYMDKELLDSVRKLAGDKGVPLCDLHALFQEEFKQDAGGIAKFIAADGVHMTQAGNALMAKHLAQAIAAALTGKPAKAGKKK